MNHWKGNSLKDLASKSQGFPWKHELVQIAEADSSLGWTLTKDKFAITVVRPGSDVYLQLRYDWSSGRLPHSPVAALNCFPKLPNHLSTRFCNHVVIFRTGLTGASWFARSLMRDQSIRSLVSWFSQCWLCCPWHACFSLRNLCVSRCLRNSDMGCDEWASVPRSEILPKDKTLANPSHFDYFCLLRRVRGKFLHAWVGRWKIWVWPVRRLCSLRISCNSTPISFSEI